MSAAVAVGVLTAGGVYLLLQRGLLRVVFGFVLLGHAVNVLIITAGGTDRREAPFLSRGHPEAMADPLPQAFVLTAIVIAFGITVYLLALVRAEEDGEGEGEGNDQFDGHGDGHGHGHGTSDEEVRRW